MVRLCPPPLWLTLFVLQLVVLGPLVALLMTGIEHLRPLYIAIWLGGDSLLVPLVCRLLLRGLGPATSAIHHGRRHDRVLTLCSEACDVQHAAGAAWFARCAFAPQSLTYAGDVAPDPAAPARRQPPVSDDDWRCPSAAVDQPLLTEAEREDGQFSAVSVGSDGAATSVGDGLSGDFRSQAGFRSAVSSASAYRRQPAAMAVSVNAVAAQAAQAARGPAWDPLLEHQVPWLEALAGVPDPGGPIFLQMLKQVRIGQSLLRITFPVFVLEPRSMIEKYSDQLVYGALLRDARREPDGYQRMLLVAKWYLSGFHLRPQGAKKPYNSILGECFACRCGTGRPGDERFVYVAEQVSHHPPVSAFVAAGDGVRLRGIYHARSRLRQPNLAESTGHGGVSLELDLPSGQTVRYQLTWPTAVVHGFLTGSMRVELGDLVTINEEESGIKAELNFRRKPWMGGEYDQIIGVIKRPDGEPTQHRLTGTWHSRVIHHEFDRRQLLIDAAALPAPRPVAVDAAGTEFQSRAVWARLTTALRCRDLDAAAVAKHEVEEAQRARRAALAQEKRLHVPKLFAYRPGVEALHQSSEKTALFDVNNWQFTHQQFLDEQISAFRAEP